MFRPDRLAGQPSTGGIIRSGCVKVKARTAGIRPAKRVPKENLPWMVPNSA